LQYKTSLGRLFQMKDAEYECERLANSVFILGIVSSVDKTVAVAGLICAEFQMTRCFLSKQDVRTALLTMVQTESFSFYMQ